MLLGLGIGGAVVVLWTAADEVVVSEEALLEDEDFENEWYDSDPGMPLEMEDSGDPPTTDLPDPTRDAIAVEEIPPRDDTSPAPEKFLIVRLKPHSPETLRQDLKRKISEAKALGLRPFVEFDTRDPACDGCRELDAHLADEEMIDAFAGTFIIRVDVGYWADPSIPPCHTLGRNPSAGWWVDENGDVRVGDPAPIADPFALLSLDLVKQEGSLPAFHELTSQGLISERILGANAWRGDRAASLKEFFQAPGPETEAKAPDASQVRPAKSDQP